MDARLKIIIILNIAQIINAKVNSVRLIKQNQDSTIVIFISVESGLNKLIVLNTQELNAPLLFLFLFLCESDAHFALKTINFSAPLLFLLWSHLLMGVSYSSQCHCYFYWCTIEIGRISFVIFISAQRRLVSTKPKSCQLLKILLNQWLA